MSVPRPAPRRTTRPTARKRGAGKYDLDGRHPPSVTTLMKGIPKQLQGWAARSVAEFYTANRELCAGLDDGAAIDLMKGAPFRISRGAAVRGTDVHRYAAALAMGEDVEPPEHLLGHVDSELDFLNRWQPEVELVETPIFNRRHFYAGTFDLLCHLDGLGRTLIDLKTSAKGDVYGEVAIQLSAYAHGEFWVDEEGREVPLGPIDSYACLWIGPDSWELYPVDVTEREWRVFLYAAEVYRWQEERMRAVVRPALPWPKVPLEVVS